ncbi:MAG: hypothetical protein ACOH19_04575 [Rhodoglobus sp.]
MDVRDSRGSLASPSAIHLPEASEEFASEVLDEIERMTDALPEVDVVLSAQQAKAMDAVPDGADEFVCLMVLAETLVGRDAKDPSPTLLAQVIFFTGFPAAPEALAVQIAFGRKRGEQQARKIAMLRTGARRHKITVAQYVSKLAAAEKLPRDKLVRLFHGEGSKSPSSARIDRGVSILRTAAGAVPEEFRPPLLCALAWLQWASGRRAIAAAYLSEATRTDPENLLAYGLGVIFSAQMPEWVRADTKVR